MEDDINFPPPPPPLQQEEILQGGDECVLCDLRSSLPLLLLLAAFKEGSGGERLLIRWTGDVGGDLDNEDIPRR